MLTQLRFKNWRSLRDVTIDNLTPITVFIGANSSGKTNIVDGLRFLRECIEDRPIQAVQSRGGAQKIAYHENSHEPIEVEVTFKPDEDQITLIYEMGLSFNGSIFPDLRERLQSNNGVLWLDRAYGIGQEPTENEPSESISIGFIPLKLERVDKNRLILPLAAFLPPYANLHEFIKERWQILDEGFKPRFRAGEEEFNADISVIDRYASNLPIMLHFLMEAAPEKYVQMQEDLQILMGHVGKLTTYRDDRETRFYLEEKFQQGREAPTISAGTARIVAMLTAYYALDIGPRADMPGLVVIEEPDTALNPGLLQRFVDLLRRYVRHGNRQFILTTHNPALLDYFQPEEVRVVTRDENGETTVEPVPAHIRDIWLKDGEYALGEVWTTNVFGGLPK